MRFALHDLYISFFSFFLQLFLGIIDQLPDEAFRICVLLIAYLALSIIFFVDWVTPIVEGGITLIVAESVSTAD